MRKLLLLLLGILLVAAVICIRGRRIFREYFDGSTLANPTDRVCICDNNYNGDTAPGSPSYMCFAYKMLDASGTIVPNCNNYISGSDQDVCGMCNADAESPQCNVPSGTGLPQDRKCIRKYCKWAGGECQNKTGPPQPSPYNPPGDARCTSSANKVCISNNCLWSDASGNRVKCYTEITDSGNVDLCDCTTDVNGNPLDPVQNKAQCKKCPYCKWCDATQKCIAKVKPCSSDPPSPSPSPLVPPPSCPDLSGNEVACSSRPDCQFCSVNNRCYLKGSNDFFNTCLPASSASFSPEQSTAAAKQKKSALLREIRTIVHNEVASELGRTTANSQPFYQLESKGNAIVSSDPSLLQGRELESAKRPTWCPKNMDDYIRKDSIPCYGCNLGY